MDEKYRWNWQHCVAALLSPEMNLANVHVDELQLG